MSKYSDTTVDLSNPNTSWAKMIPSVPLGSCVLDVGCSSGYFGEVLIRDRRASLWGIDIDGEAVERARDRGFVEVVQADVERFDWQHYGDRKFDVIVFADVLEHLREPEVVLRRAVQLLQPAGIVIASIPNIAHISIRVELMEGGFVYEPLGILDNTHTKYYTRGTAVDLLQQAGLSVHRIDATLYDLPEDLLLARLERVGLEPNDRFLRLLEEPEARAYQWILTAGLDNRPLAVAAQPEKLVMPHAELVQEVRQRGERILEMEGRAAQLEEQVRMAREELDRRSAQLEEELQAAREELDRRSAQLEGELRAAREDLDVILGSRRWKVASALARAYRTAWPRRR